MELKPKLAPRSRKQSETAKLRQRSIEIIRIKTDFIANYEVKMKISKAVEKKFLTTLTEFMSLQTRVNIDVWERLDGHDLEITKLKQQITGIGQIAIDAAKKYFANRNIKVVK